MDIMELGAIGELVGGVAVIASLIFVGFQVRQNTRQSFGALQYQILAEANRLIQATRSDRDHAALSVKANSGAPLDAAEAVQFEADVEVMVNLWFGVQQAYDLGQIEEAFYRAFCDDLKRSLKAGPAFGRCAKPLLEEYPDVQSLNIFAPVFEASPAVRGEA